MNELLPSLVLLGFFLGMRHATDPDHVIAVSKIVSREATLRNAALIGAIWGIGHSLTILVVGGAIVVFGLVIPPRVGLGMEFSVALMLILLGTLTVGGRLRRIAETSETSRSPDRRHSHGGFMHTHDRAPEVDADGAPDDVTPLGWLDRSFRSLGLYQALRPLIVGVVHGLAGSAAVALLVLAVIPRPRWAMAYLMVFGLGTVAGMMLVTATTALPLVYANRRLGAMHRYLALASGALSVAFGLFLVYRIGVVDGLFTGHPNWTPG